MYRMCRLIETLMALLLDHPMYIFLVDISVSTIHWFLRVINS